jgi:hypothetical protein
LQLRYSSWQRYAELLQVVHASELLLFAAVAAADDAAASGTKLLCMMLLLLHRKVTVRHRKVT